MCLAAPGKIVELEGVSAVVEMGGNRVRTDTTLVPEARPGDGVLVHAGFAIAVLSPQDLAEHQRILAEIDQHARGLLETP